MLGFLRMIVIIVPFFPAADISKNYATLETENVRLSGETVAQKERIAVLETEKADLEKYVETLETNAGDMREGLPLTSGEASG